MKTAQDYAQAVLEGAAVYFELGAPAVGVDRLAEEIEIMNAPGLKAWCERHPTELRAVGLELHGYTVRRTDA